MLAGGRNFSKSFLKKSPKNQKKFFCSKSLFRTFWVEFGSQRPPSPPTLTRPGPGDLAVFGPPGPFSPHYTVAGGRNFSKSFWAIFGSKNFFSKNFFHPKTHPRWFLGPKNTKLDPWTPHLGPFGPQKPTKWPKNDLKNANFSKKNFSSKTLSEWSWMISMPQKPKITHFWPRNWPHLAQKVHKMAQKWLEKRDFFPKIFFFQNTFWVVLNGFYAPETQNYAFWTPKLTPFALKSPQMTLGVEMRVRGVHKELSSIETLVAELLSL